MDILPLYDEIKAKNYQFLRVVVAINDELTGEKENALAAAITGIELSSAQAAFLDNVGMAVT